MGSYWHQYRGWGSIFLTGSPCCGFYNFVQRPILYRSLSYISNFFLFSLFHLLSLLRPSFFASLIRSYRETLSLLGLFPSRLILAPLFLALLSHFVNLFNFSISFVNIPVYLKSAAVRRLLKKTPTLTQMIQPNIDQPSIDQPHF